VRHRLSRAGDRQLNFCLHVMALAQVRHYTPGRAYYLRKVRHEALGVRREVEDLPRPVVAAAGLKLGAA
jgi:transposase